MCTTAWDARKEEWRDISSVGEMRELCGSLVVSEFDGGLKEHELGDNDCLCAVDVRATLVSAGLIVEEDKDLPGDWVFRQAK